MWPDRVSNPGPPTYESGALPIALRGPAGSKVKSCLKSCLSHNLKTTEAKGWGGFKMGLFLHTTNFHFLSDE